MPTKLTPKQVMILGGGVLGAILVLFVVLFNFRSSNTGAAAYNLTIWGTDPQKVWTDLLSPYTGGSSNANKITYTQIDPQQYQTKLLSALAAGTGPDIFEINDHDLPQWQQVMTPLPAAYAQTFNLITLQNDFPTVVGQDFVSGGQIYALPFSVDTMALIYNRDLFDSAGIAFPPKTWGDFQNDVTKLRALSSSGEITQAAAAFGGSATSVQNAADLVFLLMLQDGTQMNGSNGSTVAISSGGSDSGNLGLAAFNFYLKFANPGSQYYTWNDGMGTAEDNFVQGKVAMIFDYKSALKDIKAKAPFLNVGIAPMPQPDGATISVNYPQYLGLGVTRTAQYASAWSFILALTTDPANDNIYMNDTGEPPALRTAIDGETTDPNFAVFAAQALTARSWTQANSEKFSGIMSQAIQNVANGSADSGKALSQAQQAMNQSN